MTRIAAFQSLEDRFGREQATAIAEFIESQDKPDLTKLATKDDLSRFATKDDLKDLELRLIKDTSKTREDFSKEIAKVREDMITRMNWTTIIQVLTTVGALVALAKVF